MTTAEMFALPVGQRIVWTPDPWSEPEHAEVGANDKTGLLIIWSDGEKSVVAPHDDAVAEFAANLEAVNADDPVVMTRHSARPAGCSPRSSAPPG